MSKIENKSSHEKWYSALREYQLLILASVIVIGIFTFLIKETADDLKNTKLIKLEYITLDQKYKLRELNGVMETQQIIINKQQLLIEQMNTILNKLVPPEKIDPDKWT